MLPEDILSHVAGFAIASSYDLSRFAAVSWTWIRAIAASEAAMGAEIKPNSSLKTYWVNTNLGQPLRRFVGNLRLSRFLELAVIRARLELGEDYAVHLNDSNTQTVSREIPALRSLFQVQREEGIACTPTELHIDGEYLSSEAMDPLVEVLGNIDGLVKLSVSPSGIPSTCVEKLLRNSTTTLTSLTLNERYAASPVLRELPLLTKLEIESLFNDGNSVASLAELCPTPEAILDNINHLLQLEDFALTMRGSIKTSKEPLSPSWPSKLHGLAQLKRLEVDAELLCRDLRFDGMTCGETMTELDLCWCGVEEGTLASAVAAFPKLHAIALVYSGNRTPAQTFDKLPSLKVLTAYQSSFPLKALTRLPNPCNIKTMEIDGAVLDDRDEVNRILNSIRDLKNLQVLSVGQLPFSAQEADAFFESVACLPLLEHLAATSVGNEGSFDTAALGRLTQLRVLDLDRTELKPSSLLQLGRLQKLGYLDLTATAVDDACLSVIAGLPELVDLKLSGNDQLSGNSIVTLGRMKKLEHLRLTKMPRAFWESAEDAMRDSLSGGERLLVGLATLDIEANRRLSGSTLLLVLSHAPALRHLYFGACPCITLEDIAGITKLCKKLVTVKVGHWTTRDLPLVTVAKVMIDGLPELQNLNLNHVGTDTDLDELAPALAEVLNSAKQLRGLSVDANVKELLRSSIGPIAT